MLYLLADILSFLKYIHFFDLLVLHSLVKAFIYKKYKKKIAQFIYNCKKYILLIEYSLK
jgi:hypothetical protein